MTAADFEYLSDYALTARYLNEKLRRVGWARAKGDLKKDISYCVKNYRMGSYVPGIVDAILDSVGC